MDIKGGDKNRVFLHELIKITEGTVSEGTIFMHINFSAPVKSKEKISQNFVAFSEYNNFKTARAS